jgi:hypothetical protein
VHLRQGSIQVLHEVIEAGQPSTIFDADEILERFSGAVQYKLQCSAVIIIWLSQFQLNNLSFLGTK